MRAFWRRKIGLAREAAVSSEKVHAGFRWVILGTEPGMSAEMVAEMVAATNVGTGVLSERPSRAFQEAVHLGPSLAGKTDPGASDHNHHDGEKPLLGGTTKFTKKRIGNCAEHGSPVSRRTITALDAHRLVLLCTRPRCDIEPSNRPPIAAAGADQNSDTRTTLDRACLRAYRTCVPGAGGDIKEHQNEERDVREQRTKRSLLGER